MAELAFPYQAIAQMQLRAPRIALVIPVTRDWHHTAMHAMHALTGVWGGAGFLIIPTKRGEVSPAMLSILREYDPDSV